MTDIVVKATDETQMRLAFQALGLSNWETETYWGNVVTGGGEYAIKYHGKVADRSAPTGTMTDEIGGVYPTYDNLPGVYAYIRWNTDVSEAAFWYAVEYTGVMLTTYWRSGQADENGDPVPLPEWFPVIV